jgi:hypothetical protein
MNEGSRIVVGPQIGRGNGRGHLRDEAHGEERGWVVAPCRVERAEEVGAVGVGDAPLETNAELKGLGGWEGRGE